MISQTQRLTQVLDDTLFRKSACGSNYSVYAKYTVKKSLKTDTLMQCLYNAPLQHKLEETPQKVHLVLSTMEK